MEENHPETRLQEHDESERPALRRGKIAAIKRLEKPKSQTPLNDTHQTLESRFENLMTRIGHTLWCDIPPAPIHKTGKRNKTRKNKHETQKETDATHNAAHLLFMRSRATAGGHAMKLGEKKPANLL